MNLKELSDKQREVGVKASQGLWTLFQATGLLIALAAPVFLSPSSKESMASPLREASEERSISSRVLSIPSPSALGGELEYRAEVTAKQLRFESTSETGRPASRALAFWRIEKLERRSPTGHWEPVTLIDVPGQNLTATSFVELIEGQNEFKVTFQDAGGKRTSYSLWVKRPTNASGPSQESST